MNVPLGLALIPLALLRLNESHGPNPTLDLVGTVLASGGLFGIVYALVRGNADGWTSTPVLGGFSPGAALLVGFVRCELRAKHPMLPMRLFRHRSFSAINAASLLMLLGMFGSIFLLSQYLQTVGGYSPMQAGVRMLPWTAMPMIAGPLAGALSDRIGGAPVVTGGHGPEGDRPRLDRAVTEPHVAYTSLPGPLDRLRHRPGHVLRPQRQPRHEHGPPREEGIASGANNAIREVGGAIGVALLASIFARVGGYETPEIFTDGLVAAVWVGAAVVGVGALIALFVPGKKRAEARVTALEGA